MPTEWGPGEPPAGPWRIEPLRAFAASLARVAGRPAARPRIIAVDGRGGAGKTELAERLRRSMPAAAVLHSDDVAWAHSRFGWDDLMIDGILRPLHAGRAVHYRPPAWREHGREGHIDVPAGAQNVIIEGVGVSRRTLAPLLDVAVWIQSDFAEARHRGVRRDMATMGRDESLALRKWDEWAAEEVPFLAADRPWERASVIVCTAATVPHDPDTEVAVADGPAA
jgi:uridine kinase